MSTICDVFERIAERRGWVRPQKPGDRDTSEAWERCAEEQKLEEKKVWNEVMKALHDPFSVVIKAMDEGMEHAGLLLDILPQPKKKKEIDVEAKDTEPRPGDLDFTSYMEKKMLDFYSGRGEVLRAWAREKGLSEEKFDSAKPMPPEGEPFTPDEAQHRKYPSIVLVGLRQSSTQDIGASAGKR